MNRGDLKDRLDAKYFALREDLESFKYPLKKLGELVIQEPDYGATSRAVSRISNQQPRYIRITDFGEDGIESNHEFLTADPIDWDHELLKDDLLFARSGATVGKTYIHEDITESAIFAGYCIRFRFDTQKVIPKFVYYFTKIDIYSRWVMAIQRPSGQPNINKEEFKNLIIPVPLQISKQIELVAAMDEARSQRKQKLAEADALLSSLDDYLLNTLELEPPVKDDRKVFAISLQDVKSQGRLNSDYFHPERILALRAMITAAETINCEKLERIVDFVREKIKKPSENYLGLAHVQSNTGELTNVDDMATGDCFTFQADDVLFARLRPYLNKVYCAEMDGCCSPEFHVLRIYDKNLILPNYLAVILRSRLILAQTIHMMTGNTHPRLTNDDVTNLLIPIPKIETQEEISQEVKRRKSEAQRLRSEAETGWQAAKQWFEEQLLGGS
ncbi:restriction endonuclease subunit S [Dolichospermum sp. FACHB-1091]|uniref:restriction endonuclease subunit S n=1 Tax=Dolichospermum sp. FACHB-1091 TaxID=2692798 RepID=UPI0016808451|nr:restriction endonuclease subunit S [Dolichospermum sp. FACHB-1091]MBD2443853.1 restriction endonuclease subunit S [Dolichospermum sp. FACHB-1091]